MDQFTDGCLCGDEKSKVSPYREALLHLAAEGVVVGAVGEKSKVSP